MRRYRWIRNRRQQGHGERSECDHKPASHLVTLRIRQEHKYRFNSGQNRSHFLLCEDWEVMSGSDRELAAGSPAGGVARCWSTPTSTGRSCSCSSMTSTARSESSSTDRAKNRSTATFRSGPGAWRIRLWSSSAGRSIAAVAIGVGSLRSPVEPTALGGVGMVDLGSDPAAGTPGPVRVFSGYAGWGPGQAEAEMAEGAWLVLEARRR